MRYINPSWRISSSAAFKTLNDLHLYSLLLLKWSLLFRFSNRILFLYCGSVMHDQPLHADRISRCYLRIQVREMSLLWNYASFTFKSSGSAKNVYFRCVLTWRTWTGSSVTLVRLTLRARFFDRSRQFNIRLPAVELIMVFLKVSGKIENYWYSVIHNIILYFLLINFFVS